MYIIAGLGNPGEKYKYTKHNVGFLAIDEIAREYNGRVDKLKFKGLLGEIKIGQEKVILLKPQTYMNNSGESIREIVNFYKLDMSNLIVIVDDIDIGFGGIKIRKKGSAGTHNGLKSIVQHNQSIEFPRIKIGIGRPHPEEDLANFVLGGFTSSEGKVIENSIELAAQSAIEIVKNGIDSAMNKYNIKAQQD